MALKSCTVCFGLFSYVCRFRKGVLAEASGSLGDASRANLPNCLLLLCKIRDGHHSTQVSATGLVDFIGMTVRLPPGTENVFLGAAFLNEGALMLVHKKHLPLDGVLHQILALCMLATAVGVFAELRDPPSFFVSAFRSFSLTMHGLWMILVTLPACPHRQSAAAPYPCSIPCSLSHTANCSLAIIYLAKFVSNISTVQSHSSTPATLLH